MYYHVEGNIFESPAQTLVNTVNTAGAMGKGIAKEFKQLFPEMFGKYQLLCEAGKLKIGTLWLYQTRHKWVLNFPTKTHWRLPSKIEYIELGLKAFVSKYREARITSAAFPQLGCGNGELEWREVKSLMDKYLKRLPIDIYVYEINKYTTPEHRRADYMKRWLMNEPKAYPFEEFRADLKGILSRTKSFTDTASRKFEVWYSEEKITIRQGGNTSEIPWKGDETGNGLLELWQYFRARGLLTQGDLSTMGFTIPTCIMGLLFTLPYIKSLIIRDPTAKPAMQLKPALDPLPLFEPTKHTSVTLDT